MRDIDKDIEHLLHIKEEVEKIRAAQKMNNKIVVLSPSLYMNLLALKAIHFGTYYYQVDPEVGQYIEGYLQ